MLSTYTAFELRVNFHNFLENVVKRNAIKIHLTKN